MSTLLHLLLRTRLACVAALTLLMMVVIPGAAYASSCPAQPTTTAFTQWGDTGSYFLVPGGNFESQLAASGWIVNGASQTLGNEPFFVDGRSDAYSLTIDGHGSAVSPMFCIDDSMQTFRFFAHALGGGGNLQVQLDVQSSHWPFSMQPGRVVTLTGHSMADWAPTDPLELTNGVNLPNGQSASGQLVFDVAGHSGWQIDDIYVDPYRWG